MFRRDCDELNGYNSYGSPVSFFWVPLELLSFAIGGLGKCVKTFVSTFLLDSAVLRAMDFFNRWQTKKALHPGSAFIEGMPRTVTTV